MRNLRRSEHIDAEQAPAAALRSGVEEGHRNPLSLCVHQIDINENTYDIPYGWRCGMTNVTVTEARKRLYKLLDEVAQSHEPVQIAGKRNSAVLVGEEDWRAIQETLYLTSIPGMRQSIQEGIATPVDECDEELDW